MAPTEEKNAHYSTVTMKFTSVAPMLHHNGQLADPLNKWARSIKEITKKQKKVDADHIEMHHLEFLGSLYLHEGRPCVTTDMVEAMLIEGAKKSRKGKIAKAAIVVLEPSILIYDGPTDPETLWQTDEFRLIGGAKVAGSRVQRCRPIFREWEITTTVHYLLHLLNERDVIDFAVAGGIQEGLGDWRPRHGRFNVEVVNVQAAEKKPAKARKAA